MDDAKHKTLSNPGNNFHFVVAWISNILKFSLLIQKVEQLHLPPKKIEVILKKLPPAASWRGSGISCQVVSWSVIINHRLTLSPT